MSDQCAESFLLITRLVFYDIYALSTVLRCVQNDENLNDGSLIKTENDSEIDNTQIVKGKILLSY